MFFKKSRYLKLPDNIVTDADGNSFISKELRRLPEPAGTFIHTIEEKDRLDHLAYKYYNRPDRWWRICDANPEFMSPQELLGKMPFVTVSITLYWHEAQAPAWSILLNSLNGIAGIGEVIIEDEIRLVEREIASEEDNKIYIGEHPHRAVIITYNHMNSDLKTIFKLIANAGFTAGDNCEIGRTGKKIIIPPDAPA